MQPEPLPTAPKRASRPQLRFYCAGCLGLGSLLILIIGVVLILSPLSVLGLIQSPYKTARSPDGAWELILTAGEPVIFGPHPLTAFRRSLPYGIPLPLFSFEIANDGASLNQELCQVAWPDQAVAALTCSGQEQEPTTYLIDLERGHVLHPSP